MNDTKLGFLLTKKVNF